MEKGPIASDRFELSDFVEEEIWFVVEHIGEADDLYISDELCAYHFMSQAQEEDRKAGVGNRPENSIDQS